jgi:hypothetical protein
MAEVFSGTPVLISVRIDGPDGRMKEYHVAGQELDGVAEAVRSALELMPSLDGESAPKKARKPRRTKAQMAAVETPLSQSVPMKGKAWAD